MADFSLENELWDKGFYVVGVDEVGRAPLAGPIFAGAVIFSPSIKKNSYHIKGIKIDDSKKLTSNQRERSALWIKKNALSWAVAGCSVCEINKLGIQKANLRAMRRAIYMCLKNVKPTVQISALTDHLHIPFLHKIGKQKQSNIIKGDAISFTIAAASIIAKVERDSIMKRLSERYPLYGWSENKGYATQFHRNALTKLGPTRHHRKLFVRNYIQEE